MIRLAALSALALVLAVAAAWVLAVGGLAALMIAVSYFR